MPGPESQGFTAAKVIYHYEDGSWWAESPEYPEYAAIGASLDETRLLAHGGLRFCGAASVVDPFGPPGNVTYA